jgi:hypothetical protein
MLNRVVFGFFFGSYCLIAIVLNQVTKKINRAQLGSSPKNHMIEHENECDVAALYRRILFGAPYFCACKIFLSLLCNSILDF